MERKVRRRAWRQGFVIRKWSSGDREGWRIVNAKTRAIEAGEQFDLTIEEVEAFLSAQVKVSP